jgi:hypothetical protein
VLAVPGASIASGVSVSLRQGSGIQREHARAGRGHAQDMVLGLPGDVAADAEAETVKLDMLQGV